MPPDVHVIIQPGHAAEMDERWSVVGATGHQRWWWQAMDQHSGAILADGLGTPTDPVCVNLQQRFAPCGLTRVDTDHWGTSQRNLLPQPQTPGQEHTQKIARHQLTLSTRITRVARKTLCLSQSIRLHDSVMGLFVNRYEFGLRTE